MHQTRVKLGAFLAFSALSLVAGCGRVDRQMHINSNPQGALVYLNGQEVGRTPCTVDFTWYGKYDVALRKDGHQSIKTMQQVTAPWWQWVPVDLLADVTPGRKVDRRDYHYVMPPATPTTVPAETMLQRAARLKPLLESGEFTRSQSTTAPAADSTAAPGN